MPDRIRNRIDQMIIYYVEFPAREEWINCCEQEQWYIGIAKISLTWHHGIGQTWYIEGKKRKQKFENGRYTLDMCRICHKFCLKHYCDRTLFFNFSLLFWRGFVSYSLRNTLGFGYFTQKNGLGGKNCESCKIKQNCKTKTLTENISS